MQKGLSLSINKPVVFGAFLMLIFSPMMVSSSAIPHPGYAPEIAESQFRHINHQIGLTSHLLGWGEENKTFTTYQTEHVAVHTFKFRMYNFQNDKFLEAIEYCLGVIK